MKSFSQFKQNGNGWFKQRLVPFFNGVYGVYAKLRRAVGNPIVISDASDESLSGLKVFGKSTQNGTPTPTAPVEIVSVENPTVKVDTQNLSVPYTLYGIPVTSGGNYTDGNGQQWICDEIDFERGVYIQRIEKIKPTLFSKVSGYDVGNSSIFSTPLSVQGIGGSNWAINYGYCTHMEYDNVLKHNKTGFYIVNATLYLRIENVNDAQTINEGMNGCIFQYIRLTPLTTPLTIPQLTAYKALHTNEANTTISNDQNAWMEVMYTSK